MKPNPHYQPHTGRTQHILHDHKRQHTMEDYKSPKVFAMNESHGTLVHGGFGPEPTKITRVKNPAPIPSATKARKINRAEYLPKPKKWLTVNLCPWDEGMRAAKAGKGERACKYDPVFEAEAWDEWMDGFNSN